MRYQSTPLKAIGKPSVADVPMARRTGVLHAMRKGTVIKPPPAEISVEILPIAVPTPNNQPEPGKVRAGFGCPPNDMLYAV